MIDENLLARVIKNESDIESLRVHVFNVDKNQSGLEVSLTFLSDNIQKLSTSVDRIYDEMKTMHEKITPIQHYMQNNKGFWESLKENWIHIPTALAIVGTFYYAVTYINKHFSF